MSSEPEGDHPPNAELRKLLNEHGHGFHFAVLRRLEELRRQRPTEWSIGGIEIPVVANGKNTSIDFVLRTHPNQSVFLIGECKRVYARLSRWCFAFTPHTTEKIVFDGFSRPSGPLDGGREITQFSRSSFTVRKPYQIGLELRTQEASKEDGKHAHRYAINEAVTQVLRGTSGFVNHIVKVGDGSLTGSRRFVFVPVVFTTAKLWTTEADLGAADLETGNLKEVSARQQNWLWFNHNRSPEVRHSLEWVGTGDLAKDLELEFTRSVAIVSVAGIDEFLSMDVDKLLGI